jgi:hypothetical protein
LGFANLQGARFYKPTRTGAPYMVDTPKYVVGWFRRHPHLQTDESEPVTVGGIKGAQFADANKCATRIPTLPGVCWDTKSQGIVRCCSRTRTP